jgi:ATPase subunit of ABC transporter with duplicated ATPase domains
MASLTLPNGRPLFSNLCCNFGSQRTALVGRNGVGKTVLARILAGELPPGSGGVTVRAAFTICRRTLWHPVQT